MASLSPFHSLYAASVSLLLHLGVVLMAATVPTGHSIAALREAIPVELEQTTALPGHVSIDAAEMPSRSEPATPSASRAPDATASEPPVPARPSATRAAKPRASEPAPSAARNAPVDEALATVPHFVLGRSSALMARPKAAADTIRAEAAAPAPRSETLTEDKVSIRARLLSGGGATYPPAARAAEIEADVPVEIVVDASGHVVDARVSAQPGYGLEEAAIRAVRAYRFSPAQRDGQPVQVRMRWTVQFRLR